ncbi:MAG TPA: response regulator transcription factor [Pseudonocardiaceae bacterium]|nr:response regulator transcription factor [Pseudonocardiaceae bacterium]
MAKPSLVIGDSHQMLAEALEVVLTQQGFVVLAVALTVADLRNMVVEKQPRLCLIDRTLRDGDALAVVGELLAQSPQTKVVLLTGDHDKDSVAAALQAGVSGYLHKAHGVASLVSALRRVDEGEIVVDTLAPQPERTLAGADVRWRATYLTGREQECLTLLVEGLGTAAMAHRLGVSPTTLRSHLQGMMSKLGVHSRLEAAALAIRYSLLESASTALAGEQPRYVPPNSP